MTASELRDWMDRNGYTIHGLADALEYDASTVKRWRAGTLEIRRVVCLALRGLEGNTTALRATAGAPEPTLFD